MKFTPSPDDVPREFPQWQKRNRNFHGPWGRWINCTESNARMLAGLHSWGTRVIPASAADVFTRVVEGPRALPLSTGHDPLAYATLIATALWRRCYKVDAPKWEPFGDLYGVLSQIDNMVAGLPAARADYVPNMLRCARCNFELERLTLNANTGAVGIGTNEPERCPNGCGPLWRVTWEQEARYLGMRMSEWADRAIAAEKRLALTEGEIGGIACNLFKRLGGTDLEWVNKPRLADAWRREVAAVIAGAHPAQAQSLSDIPNAELPGMWERADFTGGQDEVRGSSEPPMEPKA